MNYKSFSQYITEATKEVTFTFGRFNPPTVGHEKLLNAVSKVSGASKYMIYASQSNDPKKNPLDYNSKVKYMRKMFPRHARSIVLDKNVSNVFDILTKIYDSGYNKVNMVVGSDRVAEFEALIKKYNGVKGRHGFYNFENGVNVISAGERDPDADDVSGMSASKMRAAASANDFASFSKGLPKDFKETQQLFNDVRKGMGLKESYDFRSHLQLQSVSEEREAYVAGDLFEQGDLVVIKESDEVGEVIMLGSNYVLVETSNGKKVRKWIDAVEKLESKETDVQFQKNLKHAVKHAVNRIDKDVDSDVDSLDKQKTPPTDELIGTEKDGTAKMFKKYDKERKHTKVGNPNEGAAQDAVQRTISREREQDKIKHDRMMDTAKKRDKQATSFTKPGLKKESFKTFTTFSQLYNKGK